MMVRILVIEFIENKVNASQKFHSPIIRRIYGLESEDQNDLCV